MKAANLQNIQISIGIDEDLHMLLASLLLISSKFNPTKMFTKFIRCDPI